ncbi:MAG TPA: SIR2 family protein [Nannocystis sp.]|jgi:hypothetical protein
MTAPAANNDWKPNGKWILVAGTGDQARLEAPAQAVARALGTELAEAGYGLVTGGWPGVDFHVAETFVARLRALGVDPGQHLKQVVHRDHQPSIREGTVVFVDVGLPEYTQSVKLSDALVVIAGLGGTYQTHLLARELGRPVLPVASAEGDGRRAYNEIRRSWDQQSAYSTITLPQFDQLGSPIDEPGRIVSVVLTLLGHLLAAVPAVRPPQTPSAAPTARSRARDPAAALGTDNEKMFQKLVETFRDPGVVGFIGAGCSIRAGYPSWPALLDKLEEALHDSPFKAQLDGVRSIPDFLWRAGRYRRELGTERYNQLIRELFGRKAGKPDEFHHDLVALPFRHVITTNYDDTLDRAHVSVFHEPVDRVEWDNAHMVQQLIAELGSPTASRRYVYLHGRFDNPESIILTEQDYQARYATGGADAKLSEMFGKRLTFIGFSLSDMDVMYMFRRLKAQIGYEAPRHFALMALDTERDDSWAARAWLNEKYGVEPVFYPSSPDHAGLHVLVKRLLAELGVSRP